MVAWCVPLIPEQQATGNSAINRQKYIALIKTIQ